MSIGAEHALNEATAEAMRQLLGENFSIMIARFISDAEHALNQLDAFVPQNDMDAIAGAVHPLKSSSGQIGAEQLSAIAEEMEDRAMDGMEVDYQKRLIMLRQAFEQVKPLLLNYGRIA